VRSLTSTPPSSVCFPADLSFQEDTIKRVSPPVAAYILYLEKINAGLSEAFRHFHNELIFYGKEFLAPRPTPKLKDDLLSAVRDYLFNILAATIHTWMASPPSAT
jgi:hypothetical protein